MKKTTNTSATSPDTNTDLSDASLGNSPLRDDEKQFIETVASLLVPRGLAPSVGRVYGYLLLKQEPQSLDQIGADLQISRVAAWNAARGLETNGHARRIGSPGSKRALFAPSDNFGAPLLEQAAMLGGMGELLLKCSATIATESASSQLEARGHFYLAVRQAMVDKIAELSPPK